MVWLMYETEGKAVTGVNSVNNANSVNGVNGIAPPALIT